MSSHLIAAWKGLQSEAGPSWRPYAAEHWWQAGDAVISNDARAPRPTYEIYTYGELVATRHRLDEAKAYLEEVYGPLTWRQEAMPKVKVDHPFFGPTNEFTDPTTIWVCQSLPALGAVVAHVVSGAGSTSTSTRPLDRGEVVGGKSVAIAAVGTSESLLAGGGPSVLGGADSSNGLDRLGSLDSQVGNHGGEESNDGVLSSDVQRGDRLFAWGVGRANLDVPTELSADFLQHLSMFDCLDDGDSNFSVGLQERDAAFAVEESGDPCDEVVVHGERSYVDRLPVLAKRASSGVIDMGSQGFR